MGSKTSPPGPAGDAAAALVTLLEPALAGLGYDLEDVRIQRAGSRHQVRVVVDRDGGLDLDGVAEASRLVDDLLESKDDLLPGAYVLEVTSPGVDRPLTQPRHWRRNLGRRVEVQTQDGRNMTGRVAEADDEMAQLDVEQQKAHMARQAPPKRTAIRYSEIVSAMVQIEFRPVEQS